MADSKDVGNNEHEIKLFPDLTKFAKTKEQQTIFENIEDVIDSVNIFLNTNKKKDFEAAKKQVEMTESMIKEASKRGELSDFGVIDVIHDTMIMPLYIIRYTESQNS